MKRPWLLPLQPLYAAGWALRSRSFDRHPMGTHRLAGPVISIGSLSAGGAGKTPFVIALGEALRRAGHPFDVLSRGYGRSTQESLRVRPDGTADEYGDEPLLIARRLACPVYVSRERYRAGQMAETDRRAMRNDRVLPLHLLDDGFQHRQLARAVDIVLLTAADIQDTLLPAGNLREPLRALSRADVIVLRDTESDELQPVLARLFAGSQLPGIWTITRSAAVVEVPCSAQPLAFCGTARPESFRASLRGLGIHPAAIVPLRDHQHYDSALLARLLERAKTARADGFVTTAKDAVKLTPAMRQRLQPIGPLAVCNLQVRIHDEEQCVATLLTRVNAWWQHSATMRSVERRS